MHLTNNLVVDAYIKEQNMYSSIKQFQLSTNSKKRSSNSCSSTNNSKKICINISSNVVACVKSKNCLLAARKKNNLSIATTINENVNDNAKQHFKVKCFAKHKPKKAFITHCKWTTVNLSSLLAVFLLQFVFLLTLTSITTVYCNEQQAAADSQMPSFLLFARHNNNENENNNNNLSTLENIENNKRISTLLTNITDSKLDGTSSSETVNLVWSKMAENARAFAARQTTFARPLINQLLSKSNVTSECATSLNVTLDRLAALEDWATLMWNSFGDFPTAGIFEGTLNAIGSYHQCVNIAPNNIIGRPQYCALTFSPVLPKRDYFHNIKEPVRLLSNFSAQHKGDIFARLASKAQYFYYIKLQIAVCVPNKCSQVDVDSIGKQVAQNLYLQYGGAKCSEKRIRLAPDAHELVAYIVLGSLATLALLGTVLHATNARALLEPSKRRRRSNKQKLHESSGKFVKVDTRNVVSNGDDATTLLSSLPQDVNAHQQKQQQQQMPDLTANALTNLDKNNSTPLSVSQTTTTTTATAQPKNETKPTTIKISRRRASSSSSSAIKRPMFDCPQLLKAVKFLLHFSILRNARKLFDTSTSRNGQSLAAAINNASSNKNNSVNNKHGKSKKAKHLMSDTDDDDDDDNDCELADVVNSSPTEIRQDASGGDIGCVHGLRFWTISWIIFGHSLQYTDWNAFGRAYQIEDNLTTLFLQPLLSASHSVDTFFLISGLLTTYVTWSVTGGQYARFNKFAFLISRYLRLTPQVMLVILIYFIMPNADDGPFWNGLVKQESNNCKQNWWINALYLQAFFKSDKICNIVTWWLSIEMFYHFVSIFIIIALLQKPRYGISIILALGSVFVSISTYIHYANSIAPGLLPMQLQRYEVWTKLVLEFFWTPYPHAPAYFVGLIVGYLLFKKRLKFTKTQVKLGWIFFTFSYAYALLGTYFWNNNYAYGRLTSTFYYQTALILWALANGWLILACSLGHGSWVNGFLSAPIFVPLGRATYMTYLSHMIVVMFYAGRANLLIEPSKLVFTYIFVSNIVLAYILGIVLTLVYESPILHLQKLLVKKMAGKYNRIQVEVSSCSLNNTKLNNHHHHHQSNNQSSNNINNNNNNNHVNIALFQDR